MSSKNPFSAFSAGGDGGWLTTKKKGKDDNRIKQDKQKALEARKALRNKNRKPAAKKPAAKKKKPQKKKSVYDSDEEDLDDFIVDDDDELQEEFSSNDSEDEVVPTKRRHSKPKKKKPDMYELSSDDDDDDVEETFGTFAKRESRPTAASMKVAAAKKRGALFDASNRRYAEEKKQEQHYSSSSEDSLEFVGLSTASRHFPSNKKVAALSKKPRDSDEEVKSTKKRSAKDVLSDSDSSDDDFPRKSHSSGLDCNDLVEDDAEAHALAWALGQSQKEERKRLKKKRKKKKSIRRVTEELSPLSSEKGLDASPANTIDEELLEESSDGGEEEQDAYEDGAAEEALSVLNATNALSAKVIQAMTGWSAEKDGDALPPGIIVDGALSMLQCAQTSTSGHSWISQELMKKVCPQVTLADYQLIGVNWLALLHGLTCDVDGKKGGTGKNVNGILADEMGLGKTVQTIAFLAWLRHHNREKNGYKEPEVIELNDDTEADVNPVSLLDDANANERPYARPHLIVVPASVLTNWEREFETFCPDMHVVKYHGSMVERDALKEELRKYLPSSSGGARPNAYPPLDVVLTTFSYFSSEKTDDRQFLRKFNCDYLVVDEAHCLKNPQGMRYRQLDKFESSHRLLLTGTPVQNSPKELMSLLCFLMPLFSRSKGSSFDYGDETKNDGGESMLQHFVSLESSDLNKDDANEAAYKKLKQLFAPFVLRRKKVDALKQLMPDKTRKLELVPFDDATRSVYDSILAAHIDKKENASMAISAAAQQHLFTALRKAANHPLLLRTRHTSEEAMSHLAKHLHQYGYFGRDETCTVDRVRQELEKFSDFDLHCAALELIEESKFRRAELERYTLSQEDLFSSPKFERLRVLLPELVGKGHRVLIFSQWTRCMDLLGCLMQSLDLKFLRLDGSTKIEERQTRIDTFNEDASIPVFLLSTRAGGMGINLTAADVCILHDLDFNPFNDIQAEDRCHRIGQTKPVTVYKMVTKDTVDADIYEMQQRKAKMNDAILESSGSAKEKPQKKEEEDAAKQSIIQSAVNRFVLTSPEPKGKQDETDI